ncbi:MAG: FGGY family carbohydrate kinase [Myxococcota bacterium]|jgi:xylulokinase|nr:FGGY family carbohydrate kinase [Myxococcota bacterium]
MAETETDGARGATGEVATAPEGLVLGLDASTTAVKALVFDARGETVAEGRARLELLPAGPGGYEQEADGWWAATCQAVGQALTGVDPRRLQGLAIAHQRETFVVTDPAGRPLRRAIVWMDERCRPQAARLRESPPGARVGRISGKPVCTTPSLAKLLWLAESEPGLLSRPEARVLDVGAFLARHLTGRLATATASADPLGLLALPEGTPAAELLALPGLRAEQLPALVPSGLRLGVVTAEAARETGLPTGLPLIAGGGDGQAAALGAGLDGPGQAYLNLGTAVVMGVVSREPRTSQEFRTLIGVEPGTFLLESDLKSGTFCLDWLSARVLGADQATGPGRAALLGRLEAEAAGLAPGSGGVFLPYLAGVMNPYWDDDASGVLLGLRGHQGPAHLYRAILEGIAFEQRLALDGIAAGNGAPVREVVVLGGGGESDLWCQMLADTLARPVVRAATREATALGAAILAAAATGLHPDLATAKASMARGRRAGFTPGPQQALLQRLLDEVYRPLYPTLAPLLRQLRLADLPAGAALAPGADASASGGPDPEETP